MQLTNKEKKCRTAVNFKLVTRLELYKVPACSLKSSWQSLTAHATYEKKH